MKFKYVAQRSWTLPRRKSGMKHSRLDWALSSVEVSRIIDRLAATPLIYQVVHRDIRRAIVRRFSYLVWYRVVTDRVVILACTYAGRDPERVKARLG